MWFVADEDICLYTDSAKTDIGTRKRLVHVAYNDKQKCVCSAAAENRSHCTGIGYLSDLCTAGICENLYMQSPMSIMSDLVDV